MFTIACNIEHDSLLSEETYKVVLIAPSRIVYQTQNEADAEAGVQILQAAGYANSQVVIGNQTWFVEVRR
jgi:predicted Zn-dependent protease